MLPRTSEKTRRSDRLERQTDLQSGRKQLILHPQRLGGYKMSLSVRIDRNPEAARKEADFMCFSASDKEGVALSVFVPAADWEYLKARPRAAMAFDDSHDLAISAIERLMIQRDHHDVSPSGQIHIAMTDRI